MKEKIGFTKVALPYGWLGNMSPHPVEVDGKLWKTTEALFQALRFTDETIIEAIRAEKSPFSAKLVAKANRAAMKITPCSEKDVENMRICLRLKVDQHPELILELKNTGDATLFEDVSSRGDRGSNLFWGAKLINGELVGENTLGKLWMTMRTLL